METPFKQHFHGSRALTEISLSMAALRGKGRKYRGEKRAKKRSDENLFPDYSSGDHGIGQIVLSLGIGALRSNFQPSDL